MNLEEREESRILVLKGDMEWENDNVTDFLVNDTETILNRTETFDGIMLEERRGHSVTDWLQMFGIFMGTLLILALITLITCRRPRKTIQVIMVHSSTRE